MPRPRSIHESSNPEASMNRSPGPIAAALLALLAPAAAGQYAGAPLRWRGPSIAAPPPFDPYLGETLGYDRGVYDRPIVVERTVGPAPPMAGPSIASNPFNGLPYDAAVVRVSPPIVERVVRVGRPIDDHVVRAEAVIRPARQRGSVRATPQSAVAPRPPRAPEKAPSVPEKAPPVPEARPALLLTLVDLEDPVPEGGLVRYRLVVTNQGDAADGGVVATVRLPAELRYVEAAGPGGARDDGRVVTLGPVATLAPGEELEWTVTAAAERAGQLSTRAELDSDFLDVAVDSAEPTTVVPEPAAPAVDAERVPPPGT